MSVYGILGIVFGSVAFVLILFILISRRIAKVNNKNEQNYYRKPEFEYNKGRQIDNLQRKGKIGEIFVAEILGHDIDGEYYVFNNYKQRDRISQIDHIVVNRHGVFVFETKNYSARIAGGEEDDNWTLYYNNGNSRLVQNPIIQNQKHVEKIRRILPKNTPIFNYVILINGRMLNNCKNVIDVSEIKTILNRESDIVLSDNDIKRIVYFLNKNKDNVTSDTEFENKIKEIKNNNEREDFNKRVS